MPYCEVFIRDHNLQFLILDGRGKAFVRTLRGYRRVVENSGTGYRVRTAFDFDHTLFNVIYLFGSRPVITYNMQLYSVCLREIHDSVDSRDSILKEFICILL